MKRIDPEADAYFRAALRDLWPRVSREIPALAGSKASWDPRTGEIVVSGVSYEGDVNWVEEQAEILLARLGLGGVTVAISAQKKSSRRSGKQSGPSGEPADSSPSSATGGRRSSTGKSRRR